MSLYKNLLLEPFYGGSHKQLIDILYKEVKDCQLLTLPAKKWHWKARTSALYFSQIIPVSHHYKTIFASSTVNLAELIALRPDLATCRKLVYFHENQLIYPVREQKLRDFQYGYNQILTALVADEVIFNSNFNMETFLKTISTFLKIIPDKRPQNVADEIRPKCRVLYFPLQFHERFSTRTENTVDRILSEDNLSNWDLENVQCQSPVEESNSHCTSGSTGIEESAQSLTENSVKSSTKNNAKSSTEYSSKSSMENSVESSTGNSANTSTNDSDKSLTEDSIKSSIGDNKITSNISASDCELIKEEMFSHNKECRKLHIVWAHRWEYDKGPDILFTVLYKLHDAGLQFNLSILGENFTQTPDIFEKAKDKLKDHILHWGYLDSKEEYYSVLKQADVSLSTARHEFYGVSMLESVYFQCFPICPNSLVYPEIFPAKCLYNTPNQLYKQLKTMCRYPHSVQRSLPVIDIKKFLWSYLKDQYQPLFVK